MTKIINKKSMKLSMIFSFCFSVGIMIMAFSWKYASYGINEKPNYNNQIAFIVQFYISITLLVFSLFFGLIWIIIILKEKIQNKKAIENNIPSKS